MRAVRGQVRPPGLEPLMLACQGDVFGPQNRECRGHSWIEVDGTHRAPTCFARSTLDTWLTSSMTRADTGRET